MFNKDITVINKYFDKDTKTTKYKVSYVNGFWSSDDKIAINGTQLVKSGSSIARILMIEKNYQEPDEFIKEPKGWTLQKDDYLVKGIVENFTTTTKMLEDYKEVIKITKIGTKDYGSEDMWHWAITGE